MTILYASNDLSIPGMTSTTTAGRFDSDFVSEAWTAADSRPYVLNIAASTTNEVWLHMDVMSIATGNNQDGYVFSFRDATTALVGRVDLSNGYFYPDVENTRGVYIQAAAGTLRTWDIRMFNDGTTRTMDIYIDGILRGTQTNTSNGTTIPRHVDVGGYDDGGGYVSQVVISDTPMIHHKFGFIASDADGSDTDWAGNHAVLRDGDYVTSIGSDTAGERASSTAEAWTGITTGNIGGVHLTESSITSTGGPQSITQYVKIAATNYDGTASTKTDISSSNYEEYILNPNTGVPWTYADLTALEFGLLSVA